MPPKTIILLLIICFSQALLAQPIQQCASGCTGDRGDNIFPDGSFGAGPANIFPGNPGIAPGYNYTTSPPPNDGSYTITNNTTPWGSFAVGNWIDIPDNGPEINGYMMVVNAAYAPGLFYSKKVTVCSNTLYEMSVDVISLISQSVAAQNIKSNVAFLIDNQTVCSTGDIPHDQTWHTYRFSFTTGPGVNEVELAFRNNAPGGIGNDLAIDNISFRACGPLVSITDTIRYCEGQAAQLTATVTNSPYDMPVYQWQISSQGGNWANIPGATTLSTTVPAPQSGDQFRLIAANAPVNLTLTNCRSVSEPAIAEIDDLSTFEISGTDTIVCNGAPGILQAGTQLAYSWSTGAQSPQISAETPGWYAVTVTSFYGCIGSDSLLVYEVDLSADAIFENPVCYGEANGQIEVIDQVGGVGGISYQLNGTPVQTTPIFSNIPAGNFQVTVKDSLGCTVIIPVSIPGPPQLTVELGDNPTITACDPIQLLAQSSLDNVFFQWTPADSLSCDNCPNPISMPLRDQQYSITITDQRGCIASDSLLVHVLPLLDVYAPNIFTVSAYYDQPVNSFFTIFTGKSAVLVNRLEICDRWGGLIFSAQNKLPNDAGLQWNGEAASGRPVPTGVYVWLAEITFSDGITRVFKGDVTVFNQ